MENAMENDMTIKASQALGAQRADSPTRDSFSDNWLVGNEKGKWNER